MGKCRSEKRTKIWWLGCRCVMIVDVQHAEGPREVPNEWDGTGRELVKFEVDKVIHAAYHRLYARVEFEQSGKIDAEVMEVMRGFKNIAYEFCIVRVDSSPSMTAFNFECPRTEREASNVLGSFVVHASPQLAELLGGFTYSYGVDTGDGELAGTFA